MGGERERERKEETDRKRHRESEFEVSLIYIGRLPQHKKRRKDTDRPKKKQEVGSRGRRGPIPGGR